jgi:hypothetical protein
MSLLDKIKSMFSGGSSDPDDHTGHDHDHAGHDHPHEPAEPPLPQADVAEMPAAEEADNTPD